jgi:hypothetical protein
LAKMSLYQAFRPKPDNPGRLREPSKRVEVVDADDDAVVGAE